MKTRPTKLYSVQALRGIAALLVLFFHLEAMFREGGPRSESIGAFWSRGYAGVDMFFVVSGFIIVYVTQNITPSFKAARQFLYARFTRVYPLWWIFAFVMMVYFWTAFNQFSPPDKANGTEILPYIVKSLLLLPQEFDPVLGVGWTLIHEVLFYLLFAIGLLFPRRFLKFWLLFWAIIILLMTNHTSTLMHARNAVELIALPLNIEFILGAFAALWIIHGKGKFDQVWFWLGLISFVLFLIVLVPGGPELFNWRRVATHGVPTALVIIGAVRMELHNKIKVPSFLTDLGDWSYSLYLSHLIVLLSIKRIWIHFNLYLPDSLKWASPGWLDNAIYIVIGLIASIVFAALSFHFVERPVLRFFKRVRN